MKEIRWSSWLFKATKLCQSLLKSSNSAVGNAGEAVVAGESFELMDLWNSYEKWSAYGAAVPLVIASAEGETVDQYYSPSLSAMQIYTINQPTLINNNISPLISRDSGVMTDSMETANQEVNSFGHKYLEFNETIPPHNRIPFYKKINELAMAYPELLTFRSTDLSPYSWVAVAWYPIYQIPVLKKKEELSASFLTYHSLSTYIPGWTNMITEDENVETRKSRKSVVPFAATTYKMNGAIWINPETPDWELISCRRSAAHSWLTMLNFSHHDYNFFTYSSANP
ncbi:uncharacterized protein LOC119993235 [Tripterygium wilfordii]|uniref:uncharacterized protein LOC119993235 n=1 Tax=Tripterygium wilfordii TaxID=458696 RepID=UPI0018F82A65|nr:uncharacterized protein LOC119993235 [Tripterygium wilfordii]